MLDSFKWYNDFVSFTQAGRKKIVNAVLEAVKIYKKGKKSPEGTNAYNLLTSDNVELIGVVGNITYLRVQSKVQDDLEVAWDHKFSVPSLLYYVKDSPFLLLANPNVHYNSSKLLEIEGNQELEEIKNLRGIIG